MAVSETRKFCPNDLLARMAAIIDRAARSQAAPMDGIPGFHPVTFGPFRSTVQEPAVALGPSGAQNRCSPPGGPS